MTSRQESGFGDPGLALQQRFEPHGRGRVILTVSRSTEYSFEGGEPSGEGVQSVARPRMSAASWPGEPGGRTRRGGRSRPGGKLAAGAGQQAFW